MNKRSFPVLVVVLLLALTVASCVPAGAPTAAPARTAAAGPTEVPAGTSVPAGATAVTAAGTDTAASAQPEATQQVEARPTVPPPPADKSRPLAKLTPTERANRFSGPAPMSIVTNTIYIATIVTDKGNIVAELYQDTPQSANNFVTLAEDGFYDGLTFHRVEPNFVIQGGDPAGTGEGGPGYTIPAEIKHTHPRGALAWARTSDQVNPKRDSSGSQFYITLADTAFLDGAYTVFGNVIQGMDVADKIAVGDKIQRIDISTASASLMPTATPTQPPTAPVPADGRPLAQQPVEKRAGLYNMPPAMTIDPKKSYQATITSSKGDIVIDLNVISATTSVNNFVVLANLGFYDGMPISYVQPDTYVVLGSPASRPDSDVGYKLNLEPNAQASKIITGSVAYYPFFGQTNTDVKSSGSQFFIALSAAAAGGANATPLNVFGSVASGQDVAKKLAAGDAITSIKITEK